MISQPSWYGEKKSIKKIANEKEDVVYKHLLSGALANFKGDFSTKNCLFDNKSTVKKSIRITESMCAKLLEDSLVMGKENSILILDLPNYYITCKVTRKGK